MVPGDAADPAWQERALASLFSALETEEVKATALRDNEAWAASQSWAARAAEFQETFLRPLVTAPAAVAPRTTPHKHVRPELNYADMYNWTNDLPDNTRPLFEAALQKATVGKSAPKILEIGTYAGTSTVEMLKLVPAATAVTVDRWEDYDEFGNPVLGEIGARKIMNIYHENMAAGGVAHRVRALRGDSAEKLIELIREGYQFDFIYVDGGHKCLDCYGDMLLSWPLLKRGGIMAVDDVLFKAEKKDTDPLAVPYAGVEYFVEKYKGQYEIVSSGYRIFLQKV
jgi:predicted O-methyltransferase YrrM